ncbi:hypothetical protein B0H12DRAFT_444879 [Mycena haematopus]|nr:hypothetical protein B0H12DRAFT_444879 [Mycena haematopus]
MITLLLTLRYPLASRAAQANPSTSTATPPRPSRAARKAAKKAEEEARRHARWEETSRILEELKVWQHAGTTRITVGADGAIDFFPGFNPVQGDSEELSSQHEPDLGQPISVKVRDEEHKLNLGLFCVRCRYQVEIRGRVGDLVKLMNRDSQ